MTATAMRADARDKGTPKRLAILGATGSIGRSTQALVQEAEGAFDVVSVASGRDGSGLARAAIAMKARFAAVSDPAGYADLKEGLAGTGIEAAAGEDAVRQAALAPADLVIGAIAGAAGVVPTFAAVEVGRTIALANKECLVCAGAPFMARAGETAAEFCRWIPSITPFFRLLAAKASGISRRCG